MELSDDGAPPCGDALDSAIIGSGSVGLMCTAATGYSFWGIFAPPTPDDAARICANDDCQRLIAAMRQAAPTECVVDDLLLYQQVLGPILAKCNRGGAIPTLAPTRPPGPTRPSPSVPFLATASPPFRYRFYL
ncbi:hypothetical protein P43SY_003869 [Pythium insidiosum]|uniref:Elicitin n=1 Tax=Pythium insidiosum TaxID=114742 RepID=A0AAD5LBD9_PYTIN|nr:hypothetical protein P43SY_003869 [Pythium insidiosum]